MRRLAAALLLPLIAGCGGEGAPGPRTAAEEGVLLRLEWEDLLPAGEDERLTKIYEDFYADLDRRRFGGQPVMLSDVGPIEEGSALDAMPQLGTFNVAEELDGARVELPGFAVPLDMSGGEVVSFLIVPYFGACIHTPPPPPNQIVYGVAEPAAKIADLYAPYWFEGTLQTAREDTELGNAAYTMRLSNVRPYE